MWAAIPLSQLGTWDGNCIYKIKDGSRRCKLSAGGDTDVRRFGNRSELIDKIRRGVSLTRQEKTQLAQGLCCLRWHSTGDIAREICEIWARQPAARLAPLPSLQSEIQSLKAENEVLAARLQSAKATTKLYYESWVGTFPQFKSLKTEIKALKKRLEEARLVDEVPEDGNECLTTKFGIQRKRILPKDTFDGPAVTAETSIPVTPVKCTMSTHFKTPADSPTCRPRASSSSSLDGLTLVKKGHDAFNLAASPLTPKTPCLVATTKSEVTSFPFAAPINVDKISPYICNLTPALASAALQSTIERDLRKTEPLEVSPQLMDNPLEEVLKYLLSVVIFLCWAGNLSFVQFTSFVVLTSVVWTQLERGNFQERLQKYYSLEDTGDEYGVHEQDQVDVVRHSMVMEMDDEVVGPGSLRQRGQWRMPEKFEFTFTATSHQLSALTDVAARFRGLGCCG